MQTGMDNSQKKADRARRDMRGQSALAGRQRGIASLRLRGLPEPEKIGRVCHGWLLSFRCRGPALPLKIPAAGVARGRADGEDRGHGNDDPADDPAHAHRRRDPRPAGRARDPRVRASPRLLESGASRPGSSTRRAASTKTRRKRLRSSSQSGSSGQLRLRCRRRSRSSTPPATDSTSRCGKLNTTRAPRPPRW